MAFAPTPALAHVKWFENEARYPVRADLVLGSRTGIPMVVCIVALALLYGLQRIAGDPHWPDFRFLKKTAIGAPTLLAVQAAIGLAYETEKAAAGTETTVDCPVVACASASTSRNIRLTQSDRKRIVAGT